MTSARKGSAEKSGSIPHTRIEDEEMIWETYEAGVKLGEGTFGKVYEAKHKETGVRWAIKTINKEKAGSSAIKLLEREVSILKKVDHPNIIRLNEVFETAKRMYLVMELCEGGELADALKERKFTESETHAIMMKLASAISYLHKQDTVHRDLKLENILLMHNPNNSEDTLDIKVTDFGLSVVKGGVGHDNMMQDFCGTPIYMAPEIIDNKTYSQQCDVWAMGVITYILICGSPPFKSKDEETLYEMIKKADIVFSDEVWRSVSDEAKHCILGMMKKDPAHRLTASEVFDHPWITGKGLDEHPTNVLEMMKLWKDDIKQETQESSAINGDVTEIVTEDNVSNLEVSSSDSCSVQEVEQSPSQDGSVTSNTSANKVSTETGRKGSGGTKKTSRTPPSSGVKTGGTAGNKTTKPSITPPPTTLRTANVSTANRSSTGSTVSKSAATQSTKPQNTKAVSGSTAAKNKSVGSKK